MQYYPFFLDRTLTFFHILFSFKFPNRKKCINYLNYFGCWLAKAHTSMCFYRSEFLNKTVMERTASSRLGWQVCEVNAKPVGVVQIPHTSSQPDNLLFFFNIYFIHSFTLSFYMRTTADYSVLVDFCCYSCVFSVSLAMFYSKHFIHLCIFCIWKMIIHAANVTVAGSKWTGWYASFSSRSQTLKIKLYIMCAVHIVGHSCLALLFVSCVIIFKKLLLSSCI